VVAEALLDCIDDVLDAVAEYLADGKRGEGADQAHGQLSGERSSSPKTL
jgi:hypothetical protein